MSDPYSVVVPTIGRPRLIELLRDLDSGYGPAPAEVVVVDDRPGGQPLDLPHTAVPVRVLKSGGRGPAAARNTGWRAASTEWIAFVDDDVRLAENWRALLVDDLGRCDDDVAATQARIVVPVPDRPPTDDERRTLGLSTARWITADMAYRRAVLAAVGGFDERFPRAYREDSDLALRTVRAGLRIVDGTRRTVHPPARGDLWSSVRAQRGNADDALMRRKHGAGWRRASAAGPGRLVLHSVATAAGVLALTSLARGHRWTALAAACGWAASTVEFAWRRIAPGPRTAREIGRMALTSAVIPPVAVAHRLRGEWRWRRLGSEAPRAILFDRDDTLVVDVPYNNDPARVRPVPGAIETLRRLRTRGIAVGVVSNQSGVAKGRVTIAQLEAVNARIEELLGPFGTWQLCCHDDDDGCRCRKPEPGMIVAAAEALGVQSWQCVMIGDTGADVDAALAAGARAILVPTARTLPPEVAKARETASVAATLDEAVELALRGAR